MAQHDMNIANDTAANVRGDVNNALSALVSQNSGTSAPATTFANMLWYDTTNNILKMRNEANSAWIDVLHLDQTNDLAFPASGRISETRLTSGTAATYTVPDNVRQIVVEMIGAGSGGGGVNGQATSGARGMAGGGASGDYTHNILSVTPGDTFTYTVGAAGAGGAAGDNNGSAGTDTTFTNGGAVSITAGAASTGGSGHTATAGDANPQGGNPATTSAGYDLLIPGREGGRSIILSGSIYQRGPGASCVWGAGLENPNTGSNGVDGVGYGSGGSGASSAVNNGTNYAGGDGAPGLIKIMEIR